MSTRLSGGRYAGLFQPHYGADTPWMNSQKVHATILTLAADEPLIMPQTTALEKEHASFAVSWLISPNCSSAYDCSTRVQPKM